MDDSFDPALIRGSEDFDWTKVGCGSAKMNCLSKIAGITLIVLKIPLRSCIASKLINNLMNLKHKIPTKTIAFSTKPNNIHIDTSMQEGHNWKTQCCKVITEKPRAPRSELLLV